MRAALRPCQTRPSCATLLVVRNVADTWNHRIVVETDATRGRWFSVREVHYTNGRIVAWTAAEAVGGQTLAELKANLTWMRNALAEPVLVERNGKLVPCKAMATRASGCAQT